MTSHVVNVFIPVFSWSFLLVFLVIPIVLSDWVLGLSSFCGYFQIILYFAIVFVSQVLPVFVPSGLFLGFVSRCIVPWLLPVVVSQSCTVTSLVCFSGLFLGVP